MKSTLEQKDGGSGTILLVDDEKELRILGSILLKSLGFTVITAANGRETLEIFHERGDGVDLILMDRLMPEMNGVETYYALRKISPSIPIVFCSGCDAEESENVIADDKCAAVIQKPYRQEQLQSTLTRLLDKNGAALR